MIVTFSGGGQAYSPLKIRLFGKDEAARQLRSEAASKRAAFTLAEVLITLAIIGIVAALTIPTLISKYHKKTVETKLKRVYSVMNQAIKLSTIDNGETMTWPQMGTSFAPTGTYETVLEWYNIYLGPYMKALKVEEVSDPQRPQVVLAIYFPDDSVLTISNYLYDMEYYTNAKCFKEDTCQSGVDYFVFRFMPKKLSGLDDDCHRYASSPGFATYPYSWDGTIEGAKNSTLKANFSCYNADGTRKLCSKLIELNGWKIPDDYPYNF